MIQHKNPLPFKINVYVHLKILFPFSLPVTYAIQLAAAMSLLDMSPWQPERVVCALGKWLSDVNNSHSLQAPSCVKEGLMCLMMSDQSKNDMAVT